MWRHGNCNMQSSARDTYKFSSYENGAFLLVEATVCCRSYYWSETKIVAQSTYTSTIEWSLSKWNGRDCDGSMHYTIILGLLLSCDYVLKFDWYCQLSSSRSNSLNLVLLRPGNEATSYMYPGSCQHIATVTCPPGATCTTDTCTHFKSVLFPQWSVR